MRELSLSRFAGGWIALGIALAALVGLGHIAGAQGASSALGPEVTTSTSCLAGNGRVDTTIVNTGLVDQTYRLEFAGLTAREVLVPAGDWARIPVTGRADRGYDYTVKRGGLSIVESTVVVACDAQPPVVGSPEVSVVNACRSGNGYVLLQFVNPTASARGYVISFDGVNNRSTTAAAHGASTRAITGRPDGVYNLEVSAGGTAIFQTSVTVNCDARPTPLPTPIAGAVASVAITVVCPSPTSATIGALVSTTAIVPVSTALSVFNVDTGAGGVRFATVPAQGSVSLFVRDLVPANYMLSVSVDGQVIESRSETVSCVPAATPTPTPKPTATPVPPTPAPTATPVPPPPCITFDDVAGGLPAGAMFESGGAMFEILEQSITVETVDLGTGPGLLLSGSPFDAGLPAVVAVTLPSWAGGWTFDASDSGAGALFGVNGDIETTDRGFSEFGDMTIGGAAIAVIPTSKSYQNTLVVNGAVTTLRFGANDPLNYIDTICPIP